MVDSLSQSLILLVQRTGLLVVLVLQKFMARGLRMGSDGGRRQVRRIHCGWDLNDGINGTSTAGCGSLIQWRWRAMLISLRTLTTTFAFAIAIEVG